MGAGATEVCLQGGIKPGYTGNTYLAIVEAVKWAAPDMHVHAFSPLEIRTGADVLLVDYLSRLKEAGLASLLGTAAEILDDEVRAVLCPDKITTAEWLEVMEAAHAVGLRSTATIMFGHVVPTGIGRGICCARAAGEDRRVHRIRAATLRAHGGADLPQGQSRKGRPSARRCSCIAVARLALDPVIANIQASWVKMGPTGRRLSRCRG